MDTLAIQNAVRHIETLNGTAYVSEPLYADVRLACENLASLCGLDAGIIPNVSDKHLVQLYSVVRRKPDSFGNVIRNIAAAYSAHAIGAAVSPASVPFASPAQLDLEAVNHAVAAAMRALNARLDPMQAAIDGLPDQIIKAVDTAIALLAPTQLTVTGPSAVPVALGIVHNRTEAVLRVLAKGKNVYLHGPAGSGKTTMAMKCAEALQLPFHAVAKVENEYLLLGFENAAGHIVRTPFRTAYEEGGFFLFDEFDRSGSGAITAINMALANKVCPFPDKLVPMHPNFRCLAAGNTPLTGQSRLYNAANQLDGSSVDRFFFMEFGYDQALELAIAPHKPWAHYVQAVRAAIADRGIEHLVTPRATIDGGDLLNDGMSWEEVEAGYIWKGLDPDTVEQIKNTLQVAGNARTRAA